MMRLIGIASLTALTALMVPWATAQSAKSQNTRALLNQRIPEVIFEGAPFEQVMEWVSEFTQANVVIRWQVIEDAGIERDKPISMKVRNLRLAQILWMIMNEAGGSDVKLAYRASGQLLIMSTEEDLSKEMITKVYDISDLLVRAPRFTNAAQLDPGQALQAVAQQGGGGFGGGGGGGFGGGGGGGGGQNLFQNTNQNNNNEDFANPADDIQRIIELITQTIEPDTWVEGGGLGSIQSFRNLLVVRNTILVHQRIGGPIYDAD